MNIIEYKKSGQLEFYVAGILPENEMIEVTQDINLHQELKDEVILIEKAFLEYSALFAPKISALLKSNILGSKQQGILPNWFSDSTNIICSLGWLLFVASLFFGSYQYLQATNSEAELEDLKQKQQIFVQDYDILQNQYDLTQIQFAEIRNPNTQTIVLASTGKVADAEATVFWNDDNKKVFVDATALPQPPDGKVYQLWALSSLDPLTPHDAGTLDGFKNNEQKLFTLKLTNEAVAFAITLEPKGGSESPTLEELYVLGTI